MSGQEFSPRDYEGPVVYRVHILEALAASDPNNKHGSKTTFIRFGEYEYPLKHIVSKATERAGKRIEGPTTGEMEKLVEKLGFDVVKRNND